RVTLPVALPHCRAAPLSRCPTLLAAAPPCPACRAALLDEHCLALPAHCPACRAVPARVLPCLSPATLLCPLWLYSAFAHSILRAWLTRGAVARLAVRNHLPLAERAHFGQHKTAKALYDDVVTRYSSPATAALDRLILPYRFPELSVFATLDDLITHLRTSDTRYRAALTAEFLHKNLPPMTSGLLLLLVKSAAAAKAREARVVEVATGVVLVEVVEAVEVAEVAVGVVVGVGASVAAVVAAVGVVVAVVAAVGVVALAVVAVGVELFRGEVLAVARGSSGNVRARPLRLSNFVKDTALGASESALPSTAPAEALHTFTLDSVLARSSTVLPFSAVPSGSLSGLHLLSFSTNLVSTAALQDAMVTTTTPGGQRVSICMCTRTGRHLATFTRRPGSSLYTLITEPPQVAASGQVSASGPVAALSSCRLLSHQTLLWHHRLGHPSLPRLRGRHSRLLVSGLPRSLPPLPPSPALPCLPCVEGRQCAAPHSSSFPPTSAPLQTLHMDVWGPARVSGQDRERYFLLVVDDYTRYTMVFPLHSKVEETTQSSPRIEDFPPQMKALAEDFKEVFEPIPDGLPPDRTVGHTIPVETGKALPFRLLYRLSLPEYEEAKQQIEDYMKKGWIEPSASPYGGGEFSSDLLGDFCPREGILQSFTLPASPQQNGVAECRIGLVMEVARTSMIHAAAPHFLWPFAGPAPSGVSQVDPLLLVEPVKVTVDSGAARGAASGGAEPASAEPGAWGC
ncbi:unnamed protein product, partial [Closterium sp. NIES-54]